MTCARDGCANELPPRRRKFCSDRCAETEKKRRARAEQHDDEAQTLEPLVRVKVTAQFVFSNGMKIWVAQGELDDEPDPDPEIVEILEDERHENEHYKAPTALRGPRY